MENEWTLLKWNIVSVKKWKCATSKEGNIYFLHGLNKWDKEWNKVSEMKHNMGLKVLQYKYWKR